MNVKWIYIYISNLMYVLLSCVFCNLFGIFYEVVWFSTIWLCAHASVPTSATVASQSLLSPVCRLFYLTPATISLATAPSLAAHAAPGHGATLQKPNTRWLCFGSFVSKCYDFPKIVIISRTIFWLLTFDYDVAFHTKDRIQQLYLEQFICCMCNTFRSWSNVDTKLMNGPGM